MTIKRKLAFLVVLSGAWLMLASAPVKAYYECDGDHVYFGLDQYYYYMGYSETDMENTCDSWNSSCALQCSLCGMGAVGQSEGCDWGTYCDSGYGGCGAGGNAFYLEASCYCEGPLPIQ